MENQINIQKKDKSIGLEKFKKTFSIVVSILFILLIGYFIINNRTNNIKFDDQNLFFLISEFVFGLPVIAMVFIGLFASFTTNISEGHIMAAFFVLGLVINYFFYCKIGEAFFRLYKKIIR